MEVPATIFTDFEQLKNGPSGSLMFTGIYGDENVTGGLIFKCPCGCGAIAGISFSGTSGRGPKWEWNGSREKPTTTPSIKRLDGCQWHGYLTDGVFKSC